MKYLTFTLILFIFVSCSDNQETKDKKIESDHLGTINNRNYTNDYFGFSIEIPSNWRIVPFDEYTERNQTIRDEISQKVDNITENKEYFETMLVVEKDTTVDSLYSYIVFMSEDRTETQHTPQKYLEYSEKFVNKDHPDQYPFYDFGPIKLQSTLGGKDFLARPTFIWTSEDSKRNQMTYCQEFGNHLLVVQVGGFGLKAEMAEARELLKTIKWKK